MKKNIFSKEFQNLQIDSIVSDIKEQGYFSIESGVNSDFIDNICTDLPREIGFNTNDVCPVYIKGQFLFTHVLAASQGLYDLITHSSILDISQKYLGEEFRLKCQRYYETYIQNKMRWHTDNKDNSENYSNVTGLIFIIYLDDTFDGEFQLVRKSHLFSAKTDYDNDYFNSDIQTNYGDDIVTFSLPKGSIIIYDTKCIHRPKPIAKRSFFRKSLFFQVDQDLEHGEKLLLNTEYVYQKLDSRLQMYLGVGRAGDYLPHPQTSAIRLPLKQIIKSQGSILFMPFYHLGYFLYNLLPDKLRVRFRKFTKVR